jgi:hypothetical protein
MTGQPALTPSEVLIEWKKHINSSGLNQSEIILPTHEESSVDLSRTYNALQQNPSLKFLKELIGWLACTNKDVAFARTAIASKDVEDITSAPLGELLYLLDKKLPENINKILIPIAIDMKGALSNYRHWVIGLYKPQENTLTIFDSKAAWPNLEWVRNNILRHLNPTLAKNLDHASSQTNFLPFDKKLEIKVVYYELQSMFDHTECGYYALAVLKKLIEVNCCTERLLQQKIDIALIKAKCCADIEKERKTPIIFSNPIACPTRKHTDIKVTATDKDELTFSWLGTPPDESRLGKTI